MPGCAAAPSAGLANGSGTGTAVAGGPAGISYRQAPYLHALRRRLTKEPSAASPIRSEWRLSVSPTASLSDASSPTLERNGEPGMRYESLPAEGRAKVAAAASQFLLQNDYVSLFEAAEK